MEQIILEVITKRVEKRKATRSSQHWFTKGKSCLTNLMGFYNDMVGWIHKGEAVDVLYFSKVLTLSPITSI